MLTRITLLIKYNDYKYAQCIIITIINMHNALSMQRNFNEILPVKADIMCSFAAQISRKVRKGLYDSCHDLPACTRIYSTIN